MLCYLKKKIINNLPCISSYIHKSCLSPFTIVEKDTLDAIDTVELNNLIGELDLFQKEHEAKEKERFEKQQQQHQHQRTQKVLHNGHSEYQTPNNSLTQTPQTHHNDSIISTSTTITGTFSHAFNNGSVDACSEKNDKISLSASLNLNYSITSNTSMMANTNTTFSDIQKFDSSDSDKYCWNDNNNDLSADTGFENPSFRHLNHDTNIVLIRDDDLPPSYYSQNATDVVVLRSKSIGSASNNNSITDLNLIDTSIEQKQRLSSFKLENNNLSLTPNGSPSHYYSNSNNNNSIPSINKGSHGSFGALMYGQIEEPLTSNKVNVNNNMNVVTSSNNNKPAITPRPASLLSGILIDMDIFLFIYFFKHDFKSIIVMI